MGLSAQGGHLSTGLSAQGYIYGLIGAGVYIWAYRRRGILYGLIGTGVYIWAYRHRGVTFRRAFLAGSGGWGLEKQVLFFLFFCFVGEGINVRNDLSGVSEGGRGWEKGRGGV